MACVLSYLWLPSWSAEVSDAWVRCLGVFRQSEDWPMLSAGRSDHHKGSLRLMTRGDASLQAVMHHAPFTAKHVRECSRREFRGYLWSISITAGSFFTSSGSERQFPPVQGEGRGEKQQGRGGVVCTGWWSCSITGWQRVCTWGHLV